MQQTDDDGPLVLQANRYNLSDFARRRLRKIRILSASYIHVVGYATTAISYLVLIVSSRSRQLVSVSSPLGFIRKVLC